MSSNHAWSPIKDLPDDWNRLTDGELTALAEVWKDQRQELEETEALQTFQIQLHRRWAIETGVIEGAYSLDRGVTETLIAEGIDANLIRSNSTNGDPERVAAMIHDHLQVLEGLFDFVKGRRQLTTGYIKELHAALLRHVQTHTVRDAAGNLFEKELPKGVYKTLPNNPVRRDGSVHEYCPPEQVASEMDNLVRLHQEHESRGVPPEIGAAWLHHAFTQIHPFADGNGRVARAISSAVFLRANLFPVLITRDERAYIPALETADRGDLSELVRLFTASQRDAVIDAVHAIPPVPERPSLVEQPQTAEAQIAAARAKLILRGHLEAAPQAANPEWDQTRQFFLQITAGVKLRLETVAFLLSNQISHSVGWTFHHTFDSLSLAHNQDESRSMTIVLASERVGEHFRGMVVFTLVLKQAGTVLPLTDGRFQMNYKESLESIQARFEPWFEAGLARGLALWQEQL